MSEGSRPLLTCSARLRPELSSAGRARALLREALVKADREEWMDSAELALGEVVANAVLHAHTPIEVSLEVRSEAVRVEVQDFNPSMPLPRGAAPQETTGRGMALVAALTRECGVHSATAEGKVVWFEVGGAETSAELSPEQVIGAWALDDDWAEPDYSAIDTLDVRLMGMPPTLWGAARQHHDAILRELVLYQAEHPVDVDLATADATRGVVTGALKALLAELPPIEGGHSLLPMVQDRTGSGLPAVDLTVRMPRTLVPAYTALRQAMRVSEQLAVEGRLLTRPGLPEILELREWVCDQILDQAAGNEPAPWRGTAQSRFETMSDQWAAHAPPQWDTILVSDSDRGVVAADDANRIVAISRSLAAALGWEVEDLVGRRVVTLIPPELREAHVAGFSRHLHTGQAHALGVPLELPVLRRDDTRVLCSFMVEQAPAHAGRSVYIAWIEPIA